MKLATFEDVGTLPQFARLLQTAHYVLVRYKGWSHDNAVDAVAAFGRRYASLGQEVEWTVLEDDPWELAMRVHYADEIRTQPDFIKRHPELFVPPTNDY